MGGTVRSDRRGGGNPDLVDFGGFAHGPSAALVVFETI